MSSSRVFVAIGSNIEPEKNIPLALARLDQIPGTRLVQQSRWYRTSPWGIEEQAEFINLVVELATGLTPFELLAETQAIEQQLGRERTLVNGPRPIDLDMLLFDRQEIVSDALRLPHPGLTERDFMLIPLIEIAPDRIHPGFGLAVSDLVDRIRYRQILGTTDSHQTST